MPNHITTKILIGADEETRKAIRVLLDEKYDPADDLSTEGEFDFEKVLPMPEGLKGLNVGGCKIDGVECGVWREETINLNVKEALEAVKTATKDVETEVFTIDYNGVKYELYKWQIDNLHKAEKSGDETFTITKKIALPVGYRAELVANYGTDSWYDWACTNWGTKWNSYDVFWSNTNDWVEIQTAWSTPHPVITALSKMFPMVSFVCLYADEDLGNNCGVYVCQDGYITMEFEPDENVAYKYATIVKGFDEDEWDDEETEGDEEPSEPIDPNNFMLRIANSEDAFEVLRILKED